MMKTLRRQEGATKAAAGTVARAGRARATNEGAANTKAESGKLWETDPGRAFYNAVFMAVMGKEAS